MIALDSVEIVDKDNIQVSWFDNGNHWETWDSRELFSYIVEQYDEIARLTAESTKWESKFYDEAKKVDKAIEYIRQLEFESEELYDISEIARLELLEILKGSDKE